MGITLQKRQALFIVLLTFILSVLVRVPNLNRPVSKHHEFITALILINLESWRQAGGGEKFNYTPVMNYQNTGDKHPEKAVYIDSAGNQLYLSLGPAWYMIPYFVYEIFDLPVEPVYLRILNLLFNLVTLLLAFYFFRQLIPPGTSGRYLFVVAGCLLLQFTPGMLWYSGNGYVHTAIILPVVIAVLMILLPMLPSPQKITSLRLLGLGLLVILLVYMDWLPVFICFCTTLWILFRRRRDKQYLLLASVLTIATLSGMALVFEQFASYAGWPAVSRYWQLRFGDRSIANAETPLWQMLTWLFGHFITSYLPLVLLTIISAFGLKFKKVRLLFSEPERRFLYIYGAAVIVYEVVLISWSSAHDFALIPAGILLAYIGSRLFLTAFKGRTAYIIGGLFLLFSTAQYYYINRPGPRSRDGMAYNTFEVLGRKLKQVPADHKIFMHLGDATYPMIEYYASRNITNATNIARAQQLMQQWGITKAVWVEHDNFQFRQIVVIQ